MSWRVGDFNIDAMLADLRSDRVRKASRVIVDRYRPQHEGEWAWVNGGQMTCDFTDAQGNRCLARLLGRRLEVFRSVEDVKL